MLKNINILEKCDSHTRTLEFYISDCLLWSSKRMRGKMEHLLEVNDGGNSADTRQTSWKTNVDDFSVHENRGNFSSFLRIRHWTCSEYQHIKNSLETLQIESTKTRTGIFVQWATFVLPGWYWASIAESMWSSRYSEEIFPRWRVKKFSGKICTIRTNVLHLKSLRNSDIRK